MGKDIDHFYKHNQLKLSTPTLNKPVLSPSDSNTSSASNSTRTSIWYRLDNKHISTNHNKNNISNKDYIQSYVTPRKQNYSFQDKYTPTNLTQLNATLPITSVKLHTTAKLSPAGKEYLCLYINSKYSQADKCVKSMIMTNVVDYILYIYTFEK